MDQINSHRNDYVGPLQNNAEYDVPVLGLTGGAGVNGNASHTTDRRESTAGESVERTLCDNHTFTYARNLARDNQKIEREKSEGARPSKTVDGLPKCEIVAVVPDAGTELRRSTGSEKSADQSVETISHVGEIKALNELKYDSREEVANIHLALSEDNADGLVTRLSTMGADQLAQADKDYQNRYHKSLREAIKDDDGLTDKSKEAMLFLLDTAGHKRTPEEWNKLFELSLQARKSSVYGSVDGSYGNLGDLKMFADLMAAAHQTCPEACEQFIASGGMDKIEKAFADDGSDDAKDYAKGGKISVENAIGKCDKVNDDEDGIMKALDTMDQKTEREPYVRGARIFKENFLDKLSVQDRKWVLAKMNGEYVSPLARVPDFDPTSLAPQPPLTAEKLKDYEQQLKDYEKFKSINSAIDGPADDDEHRDWRDRAIYSGGVEKAVSDLDNIPWNKASAPQGYKGPTLEELRAPAGKEQYLKEMHIDLMSEHAQKNVLEALDKKLAAEKPEDLKYVDGKAIDKALEPGFMQTFPKKEKVLDGIQHMRLEDQKRYHDDPEFRGSVDRRVALALAGDEPDRVAAMHMLARIAQPERGYPVGDFIDNINIEAGKSKTNERQVVRYVEEQFTKDLTLRDRLANPQTPEDKELAQRLDEALHRGLDSDQYAKWAKPVLEKGWLSFEQRLQLDKDKGDKKDYYKDVTALATATDAQSIQLRHKLATDASYREQVLGQLPEDQRGLAEKIIEQSAMLPAELEALVAPTAAHAQPGASIDGTAEKRTDSQPQPDEKAQVLQRLKTDEGYRNAVLACMDPEQQRQAIRVFEQGPVLPEDTIRAYKLGVGSSKDEAMATLRNLHGQDKEDFKNAYAYNYHAEVGGDLSKGLDSKEEREMQRLLRKDPETLREMYFQTREDAADSNSGVGAEIAKAWTSGTGDLAEDQARQMYAMLEKQAEIGQEMSPEEQKHFKELSERAYEFTELFQEAKGRTADDLAEIALGAATLVVPGGMSLRLLLIATGGGLAKVGIKEAIAGHADFADFVSGFVNTGLTALGPGELAKVMGLGKKVALEAGEKVAKEGGHLLAKGAARELSEGLRGAAAEAFAHGSGEIPNKVLDDLVSKAARKGATNLERAELRNLVVREFTEIAEREVRGGIQNVVMRQGVETGAGFVGGFTGGATGAAMEWDPNRSFSENMARVQEAGLISGAMGAGGAFALGNLVKIGGKGLKLALGKESAGLARMESVAEGDAIAAKGEVAAIHAKPAEQANVSSSPSDGRNELLGKHLQALKDKFQENPLYAPSPEELQRFLDEASTRPSSSMMIRGAIDDAEKQTGVRITARDHERLLQLRQEADSRGLSLELDRELELHRLELRFATVRRLYKDRTGQSLPARHLAEALGERPLSPAERAHVEVLYSARKNIKISEAKYVQYGEDLTVTRDELQKLESTGGALNLIRRLEQDQDGALARHLFDRGRLPAEVQDLIRTYKQSVASGVDSWTEQLARNVLEGLLDAQKGSLEIAREVMSKRHDAGLQEVEAYLVGRKLKGQLESEGRNGLPGTDQQAQKDTSQVSPPLHLSFEEVDTLPRVIF